MKAWHIFAAGVAVYAIGRWARNEKAAPSAGQVGGAVFVMFALDLADTGAGTPIARGFAWLFTTAAILNSVGPITKNLGAGKTATAPAGGGGADAEF